MGELLSPTGWRAPRRKNAFKRPLPHTLCFFGFGEKDQALKIIEGQIKLYEEQFKHRQDNITRWQHHDTYVRLMAELGVTLNEMFLNWLKHARKEISESSE